MKKIDLHIHTIPADDKDAYFEFDVVKLENFVNELSIDALAITNHNLFDLEQFKEIKNSIQNVFIFPGIEIDFEGGHLLVIAENENIEEFNDKCELIKSEIENENSVTLEKLKEILVDLEEYLLIPHYDKEPKVNQSIVDSLPKHFCAGEVQSPKKFQRAIKDSTSLTPVLFHINTLRRQTRAGVSFCIKLASLCYYQKNGNSTRVPSG